MKGQYKINTAVLFSGGKDSALALLYALKETNVKCLINIISENDESYMFHVPNVRLAEKQAEYIGLPIIIQKTKGEKEKELEDLELAIKKAIKKYNIEAVVTGAIASIYQASRIHAITDKLNIKCINPLWNKDQFELLQELVDNNFDVLIVGVFGEGLDELLGKKIDQKTIKELNKIYSKLKINPAGEGGEYETLVLNAPYYKKPLRVKKYSIKKEKSGGKILVIEELSE
ncbi:MAG: TIGR00289 family protein [Candidatus Woesearchaeota archaeon]|nr:MAG: TIGR00289 family protein [Candidatus Woesearchaeota archaeon]